MGKEKVELNIAGKNYTFYSCEDKSYLQRIASYVGRKMDEIYMTSHITTEQAAVMTAMNVAEELMKAQDENRHLRFEINSLMAKEKSVE